MELQQGTPPGIFPTCLPEKRNLPHSSNSFREGAEILDKWPLKAGIDAATSRHIPKGEVPKDSNEALVANLVR